MRISSHLARALAACLIIGLLGSCGVDRAAPSRQEVLDQTTQSLIDAITDYGAALEELLDHEALKPFLEVLGGQGLLRIQPEDGGAANDPAPAGDVVVIENDFSSAAREAADAVAEHLKTKVFTEEAVESVNGDTVTFLLGPKAVCFEGDEQVTEPADPPAVPMPEPEEPPVPGDSPEAPPVPDEGGDVPLPPPPPEEPRPEEPRPEEPAPRPTESEVFCPEELTVEIRLDARKDGDAIEIGVRIDDGGTLALLRFEPQRIALTIDLAEVKKAYESLATKADEPPPAKLLKAVGKLQLALDRPAQGDRRASVSVVEAIDAIVAVGEGQEIRLQLGKVTPLLSARITRDEVDLDIATEGASLALPLGMLFEPKQGGSLPESVFSLAKSFLSLELRKDQLVALELGRSEASWTLGGDELVKATSAALSATCTQVADQDRAACSFDPGLDVGVSLALSKLEALVTELFEPAMNDSYSVLLSGSAPQVELGDGPSSSLLKVIAGTLKLEQQQAGLSVEVQAGQCLLTSETDAEGFAGLMAGQCI